MKKSFISIALFICAFIMSSCDENFLRELLTGSATTIIGENEPDEYTSSIVLFGNVDSLPFALGLATTMDVEQLMNLHGPEDISFPLMTYRISDSVHVGQTFYIDNELTEEDLEEFNYEWLINGKFADKNFVGVAESDTLFYIMQSGEITVTSKNNSKMLGTFSGNAYVINLNADPMLSEEQVSLVGEFTSRIAPTMDWLMLLQSQQELAEAK
jgi:hypothetical protein